VIGVERTDFVTLMVRDKERAFQFYGETLGLERNSKAHEDWPEFETGNLTIRDPDGNSLMLHRRYAP
jgi:catechol 2,3-dioxygenase-like lactoylglutathione lyase family enzyme